MQILINEVTAWGSTEVLLIYRRESDTHVLQLSVSLKHRDIIKETEILAKTKSICRGVLYCHNAGELLLSRATYVWHSKMQSTQGKPWD